MINSPAKSPQPLLVTILMLMTMRFELRPMQWQNAFGYWKFTGRFCYVYSMALDEFLGREQPSMLPPEPRSRTASPGFDSASVVGLPQLSEARITFSGTPTACASS